MKIQAESQNIGGFPKSRRISKIEALSQNLGGCLKFRRQSCAGIVKLLRHIIYARAKADVEISAPDENYFAYQKSRHSSYAPIRKLGAQTLCLLTIWARQNLQLLTSSKSG
jgi:hypothetical protein